MKKRIFYIISFLVIFCIEVLIALYVRDNFVRPYIGDVLVVVLVYSFVRIFLPTGIPRMPFYVFLFACFIEVMQYFQLVETLGERVAERVRQDFGVSWLRLTLRKPGSVRAAREVGVIIERGSRG